MPSTQEQISTGAIFLTPEQIQKQIQETKPTDFAQRMADQRYLNPKPFETVQRYEPESLKSINKIPEESRSKVINQIGEITVKKIENINPEAFNSIDWTKVDSYFLNNKDYIYSINVNLLSGFVNHYNIKINISLKLLRNRDFFVNPNFEVEPKFKQYKEYNQLLNWIHGDNRTI